MAMHKTLPTIVVVLNGFIPAIGYRMVFATIKNDIRSPPAHTAARQRETIHGVISGIFNEAIEQELINANPASGLLKKILPPLSKRDLKRADPLTQEELNHFMAHAQKIGSWAELLILKMMAFAGLRLGEALAMRREYMDTRNRTYFVCQSFNRRQFNRPKHGKRRLIDLPDFLVEEIVGYVNHLKKERLRTGSGGKINLLFIDLAEKRPLPYSQRKIQYLMKKVSKAAGLRIRNPHDLRHYGERYKMVSDDRKPAKPAGCSSIHSPFYH